MKKTSLQRIAFLFLAVILLLISAGWNATIYGNDARSIQRYIYQVSGDRLKDHVHLLAVEDRNDDRIVIFRRETKKPDEVFFVRFRKNVEGNYEGYAPAIPVRMYCGRPGSGIWSESISGWGNDPVVYYVVWSENDRLHEIVFRLNYGPEQRIRTGGPHSLTVFEFQPGNRDHWRIDSDFYDAAGSVIH